jgi:hypothetical protein
MTSRDRAIGFRELATEFVDEFGRPSCQVSSAEVAATLFSTFRLLANEIAEKRRSSSLKNVLITE